MTQIVIDIPASLATLIPTLPPMPHWTDAQATDFVAEGIFAWLAIGGVMLAIIFVIAGVRALQTAARLPEPPPYYRGPSFFQWLRESKKQPQR